MSKRVLPLIPANLIVNEVLSISDNVVIQTSPCQASAPCPTCAHLSGRLHSRYQRTLADLPWQGRPVALQVQARRFRCLNPACARQTFAERLPGVASVAARRTERLGSLEGCLGLALGGEAGKRLAERLAMPISADTLLRMTREAGDDNEAFPTPRVLAVDDWAELAKVPTAKPLECLRRGGAAVAVTGPSWSTWSATWWSISCLTDKPGPWPSGCAGTPGSRSWHATGPAPMRTGCARARRMRSR